eukprot:CAMPEP_0184312052 /NCGR_PEP_ID=MMETSP1049-20130417/46499_1 /TAXON_ID=77928 /ORGANISM="Proteomonas sulcata, Strain CCMP704" /LENGTH=32 /DNA_ID= /DNA_START= /DNA_END= /DNA_ORIENTATION=
MARTRSQVPSRPVLPIPVPGCERNPITAIGQH